MAEKKQLADVVICDLCDSNRFSPMFNVGTWHLVWLEVLRNASAETYSDR